MSAHALEGATTARHFTRMLSLLAVLAQALRSALLVGGIGVVALAAIDWAVRTRRLSPFSGIARFTRTRIDPRLVGVERMVLRGGGHQSATPWWAVVAFILVALLLLAFVDLALSLLRDAVFALSGGTTGIIWLIVHWTFGFLIVALMVRVISSWIRALALSRWTSWSFATTEWMLKPLRQVLPTFGPVDLSPIVAYFALTFTQYLVENVFLSSIR